MWCDPWKREEDPGGITAWWTALSLHTHLEMPFSYIGFGDRYKQTTLAITQPDKSLGWYFPAELSSEFLSEFKQAEKP